MEKHAIIEMASYDTVDTDVSHWSPDMVCKWLKENGHPQYESCVHEASFNGEKLLKLSRNSLYLAPFHMTDSNEIDQLNTCIESLKNSQLNKFMKTFEYERNGKRNGYINHIPNNHSKSNGHVANGYSLKDENISIDGNYQYHSNDKTPLLSDDLGSSGHSTIENYPTEIFKTIVSIGYMFTAFFVSVFTLQLVHERVPSMTEDPPLPDIFFDVVPRRVEKAFSVCESIGMILTGFVVVLIFFHKHRSIIVRRLFFILGTLYFYRSITIYVTTLPVPGMHFKCAPKANGKLSVMIGRAFGLLFGGGLSLTGSHHLCGDYLFSGHTIILIVTYLAIYEYSPKRWWWLHWACWLLSATGIVCILLAHDHYTIDVVIAYLLTTRLFWSYHTMCNIAALKDISNSNMLSRSWWFNIFAYFEGNVASNGALPRQYEWPLPWPRFASAQNKRSPIKGV